MAIQSIGDAGNSVASSLPDPSAQAASSEEMLAISQSLDPMQGLLLKQKA